MAPPPTFEAVHLCCDLRLHSLFKCFGGGGYGRSLYFILYISGHKKHEFMHLRWSHKYVTPMKSKFHVKKKHILPTLAQINIELPNSKGGWGS